MHPRECPSKHRQGNLNPIQAPHGNHALEGCITVSHKQQWFPLRGKKKGDLLCFDYNLGTECVTKRTDLFR